MQTTETIPTDPLIKLREEINARLQETEDTDLNIKTPSVDVSSSSAADIIQQLVQTREIFRTTKQYVVADYIRDNLEMLGIVIEDSSSGTTWEYQP